MSIVKNGAWIAIDSVEHDDSFEGTGRPGDQLKLKSAWQSTLNAWTTAGPPPSGEGTQDKMYGMKNGKWTVIDAAATSPIVDGKNSTVVDKGDNKIAIDVDISPELDGEILDFTK